jgi:hypothetical protein
MPVTAEQIKELRTLLGPSTVFLPVQPGGKPPWDHARRCPLSGWQKVTLEEMTEAYFKRLDLGNVGVLQGAPSDHLCSFDIDHDDLVDEFLYQAFLEDTRPTSEVQIHPALRHWQGEIVAAMKINEEELRSMTASEKLTLFRRNTSDGVGAGGAY